MKRLLLFLVSILSVTNGAFSQDLRNSRSSSYYTYIYKINEKQAKIVFQKGIEKIDDSYFTNLVDTFRTDNVYPRHLKTGHYLQVHSYRNQLKIEFHSVNNVDIKILNNNRDLSIVVNDTMGRLIEDALIRINHTSIPFDGKSGSYRLDKTNQSGLLQVTYAGHTNYFKITNDYKPIGFRRVKNRVLFGTPIKYVALPVRFVCHIPIDAIKSIRQGYSYGTIYQVTKPFRDMIESISYGEPNGFFQKISLWFNKGKRGHNGYMVFNKPRYLPGDTVFVKAMILDYKNRPIRDSLKLIIYSDNEKVIGWVKPYRRGAYKYSFIADKKLGLKLGKTYFIYLNKGNVSMMQGCFTYEEYELKSTKYDLRSEKTNYRNGEQVAVYCKGSDENELNLPDSRVQLTVTTRNISDYYASRVFVPDTLWKHNQNLDALGETKIILPDSIFPQASLNFSIEAHFLNSSNELQTKNIALFRDNNKREITCKLTGDSLSIGYSLNGKPATTKAVLKTEVLGSEKTIFLPCREKVNPFASSYSISTDSTFLNFALTEENSGIQCISDRTCDSVRFSIANIRKIPVSYTIFRKNKPLFRGNMGTAEFKGKTTTKANYFASVQYIWGGEVHHEEYNIPFKDKKLEVKMYQPDVVYPGQKTTISIAVTDATGKPASNVDITAFANTKKFHDNSAPNLPYFGKIFPQRTKYNSFNSIDEFNQMEVSRILNWKHWNQLMSLDTIALYRFLYPDSGFYQTTFLRKDTTFAEVSPFLADSGSILPVNLVYIDGELVYSDLNTTNQPYVFRVSHGWHQISLRTNNKEVHVYGIFLKKGTKTILSVNPRIFNPKFYATKKPVWYLPNEQYMINQSMAPIRNTFTSDFAMVKQGQRVELLNNFNFNSNGNFIAGPFQAGNIAFENPNVTILTLQHEPGFEYEFRPNLVKMRTYQVLSKGNRALNYKLPREDFNDSVYTYQNLKAYWELLMKQKQSTGEIYYNPVSTQPGNAKLILKYQFDRNKSNERPKNILVFSQSDPDFVRVYPGTESTIHDLKPGFFKLLILLFNNDYLKVDSICLKPYGTNYCAYSFDHAITADRKSDEINKIIAERVAHYQYTEAKYPDYKTEKELKKIMNSAGNTKTIVYNGTTSISGQIFDAIDHEPMPGVSIVIKGTTMGTVTDKDGYFRLDVPNGLFHVAFSFVGYASEEVSVSQGSDIRIFMNPDIQRLDEVVVVGHGIQRKSEVTGSIATVSSKNLQGKISGLSIESSLANIRIRGMSVSSKDASVFYVVDGIPTDASQVNYKPEDIESIDVLKDVSAIAIYGSRASNGAVIIKTKNGNSGTLVKNLLLNKVFMAGVSQSKSIRNQFSDYAFWKPDLVTNDKGVASFDVVFPDDVTAWKSYALAFGKKATTGQAESEIKSFKPVMTNLAVPRFLITGDKSNLIGKALNYTPDSISIHTRFDINDSVTYQKDGSILTARIDTFQLNTPLGDSVK